MQNLICVLVVSFEFLGLAMSAVGADVKEVAVSPAVLDVEAVDGYFVSRRLASVRVGTGGGASGTILFVGDWKGDECGFGVSVAHAGYTKNDTFAVGFVDGSEAVGRCVDVDTASDLMLFVVESESVIGVAPLSDEQGEPGDYSFGLGYPSLVGPKEKRVSLLGRTQINGGIVRTHWQSSAPGISPGDSGGGLFLEDSLVGVISHRDDDGSIAYGCTQPQLVAFMRRNRDKFSGCENGQCQPRGPRDPWWLQPNVDVEVPRLPRRTDPNDIEKPRRPDINGPLEQKKAIAELQVEVKALLERVAELEKNQCRCQQDAENGQDAPPAPIDEDRLSKLEADHKVLDAFNREMTVRLVKLESFRPEKGPKGDPGEPGKDGKDAVRGPIEIVLKWEDGTLINRGVLPGDKSRVIQLLERSKITSRQELTNWSR